MAPSPKLKVNRVETILRKPRHKHIVNSASCIVGGIVKPPLHGLAHRSEILRVGHLEDKRRKMVAGRSGAGDQPGVGALYTPRWGGWRGSGACRSGRWSAPNLWRGADHGSRRRLDRGAFVFGGGHLDKEDAAAGAEIRHTAAAVELAVELSEDLWRAGEPEDAAATEG